MKELDEFAYLWDGSEPGWCLVRVDAAGPMGTPALAIYNRTTAHAVIIEDEQVYTRVVEHMMAEGCPVVQASDIADAGSNGASEAGD